MIVDILGERGYNAGKKISNRDLNRFKVEEFSPNSDFQMINGAIEELMKAAIGAERIREKQGRYRECNDPIEAEKMYKHTQDEHVKTDLLLKTAKEMLSDERNTLNGGS